MTIAKKLAFIEKQKADLEAEAAILRQFPEDTNISMVFISNGTWHVNLGLSAGDMLQAFPPLNSKMELNHGNWEATPEDRPLDWEQPILGIWGHKSGVSWYHKLPSGLVVQMTASNTNIGFMEGYERRSEAHTYVWARVPAPSTTAKKLIPSDEQAEAWAKFAKAEDYNVLQRLFVNAVKSYVQNDRNVTFDMLPVPANADVMKIGDDVLQVLRCSGDFGPKETYPEGGINFSRIGQFWQSFDRAQAERLIAFAQSQRCNLERLDAAARADAFECAKQALRKLEATYLTSVADSPVNSVLTRWVQQETGYPIEVTVRTEMSGRIPGRYSLWLVLQKFHEHAELNVPAVYDKKGFSYQAPAFYEYVPNRGTFARQPSMA